jgi:stage II sporulation protein GA (sporulation sigma-E factor processing peptidase)
VYYEFYIDQFFLEHLLIGYLLLRLTAKIGRQTISWKRLLGGSFINTVLMLLAVLAGNFWWYLVGLVLVGSWVFRGKSRRTIAGQTGLLFFVTVCFGGAMEALLVLWRVPVLIAGAVAAVYLEWAQRSHEKQKLDLVRMAQVELTFRGKCITVAALIDTGNQLTEPLTGKPVSIIEEKTACSLLGEHWEKHRGFYLIPYHSIGKNKGWMRGVTIDGMTIMRGEARESFSNPILALYDGRLSAKKQYGMILHPQHTVPGRKEGGM